jgi:exopolysaccharide production protein ExoZ
MHYRSIHYARAAAASMVMLFHLFLCCDFMNYDRAIHGWLRGGVDIFFIISGFVMMKSTDRPGISAWSFFIDRLKRVVPMYWLFTTMMLGTVPGYLIYKIASYFFIPLENPAGGHEPLLNPGWTLIFEMHFYLVFAFSLFMPKTWRLPAVTALLATLGLLGYLLRPEGIAAHYLSPFFLEFLVGVWIARLDLKGHPLLLPLGVAAMILMYPSSSVHVTGLGLGATMVVLGALGFEGRIGRSRLFDLLGDSSYVLYLSHIIIFTLLLALGLPHMIFPVVAPLAAIGSAVVIHLCLEKPATAWLKRRNAATRGAPAMAQAPA